MNRGQYGALLERAREQVIDKLGLQNPLNTALVLGTGWADAFAFEPQASCPLDGTLSPLFGSLEEIAGHSRRIEVGTVNGHMVLVLRGRVHMNEATFDPIVKLAVRAQIELMLRLGVKNLILTTGVGSLRDHIHADDVVLINGWVSSLGEEMPLFGGEFVNPEDVIARELFPLIRETAPTDLLTVVGTHVFWRGPHFEGRLIDKTNMANHGGDCVSMSVKPEACVAALHPNVRIIPLGFVCNGPQEKMSHDHHRDVAKEAAPKLGALLQEVVRIVHDHP